MKLDIGNYIVKFVLTNFIGCRIAQVENEDGDLEECVCIPLDRNNLKKNKKNQVSAYAFMNKSDVANMYGWTHYLKMKTDPAFVKRCDELGIKQPYLGNAKDSNYIIHKKAYQQKLVKTNDYE
jgi:hypothetical protein